MTTIVNTPGNNSSDGTGLIVGVIVLIVLGALFFIYGLPAIRGGEAPNKDSSIDVNVKLPTPTPADTTQTQ